MTTRPGSNIESRESSFLYLPDGSDLNWKLIVICIIAGLILAWVGAWFSMDWLLSSLFGAHSAMKDSQTYGAESWRFFETEHERLAAFGMFLIFLVGLVRIAARKSQGNKQQENLRVDARSLRSELNTNERRNNNESGYWNKTYRR